MSLITDISTIVTALYPTATYILSSKFKANLKSFSVDSTAFPLIILDNEIRESNEFKANNNVMRTTRILISIYSLDDFNNTDTQSNTIAENMKVYADRIAAQIYQLLPVRPDTRQKYDVTPDFHAFNTNVTGVILDMSVNYNSVVNFDLPPED